MARGKKTRKPTVYLDTTIISAYWYAGRNLIAQSRRLMTRDWWDTERPHFSIWASTITEDELAAGIYPRQAEATAMARRLPFLSLTSAVRRIAQWLLDAGVVPQAKPADAQQLAVAVVHEVDFLLTWNYAHLANATTQRKLESVCERAMYCCPILVSPESIPRVTWGAVIVRKKK